MGRVRTAIETVIEGKRSSVDLALVVLLAEGHLLSRTSRAWARRCWPSRSARSIACTVRRVQFTPDLLPSDITGVSVFNQETRDFEFKPGGIFANIVVGDEINRASPKTQSALLESMEERQVSVDGTTYLLEAPFMVVATQNPIEMEGTYPLPEAQRDRFMARIADGLSDAQRRARHAGVAWLDRPAGRAAAGDRRQDDPRPGRSGQGVSTSARPSSTTWSRSSTRPATPAISGSAPRPRATLQLLRASRAFARSGRPGLRQP